MLEAVGCGPGEPRSSRPLANLRRNSLCVLTMVTLSSSVILMLFSTELLQSLPYSSSFETN